MPININTSTMSSGIKVMYEKRLLSRALPRLLHSRWAKKATISRYGSMEVRKYGSLGAITSVLGDGSTPGEQSAPAITTVTLDPIYM